MLSTAITPIQYEILPETIRFKEFQSPFNICHPAELFKNILLIRKNDYMVTGESESFAYMVTVVFDFPFLFFIVGPYDDVWIISERNMIKFMLTCNHVVDYAIV